MFVWGVLKRGIPESVRFCIGDLPMYIFLCRLIPTFILFYISRFGKNSHNCDSYFKYVIFCELLQENYKFQLFLWQKNYLSMNNGN